MKATNTALKIDPRLWIIATFASITAAAAGMLITGSNAMLPFALMAGLAGLFITVARIDLAWLLFVFLTYTRFPDVLSKYHGLPAIDKPFLALLLFAILVRKVFYDEESKGFLRIFIVTTVFLLVNVISMTYAIDLTATQKTILSLAEGVLIAWVAVIIVQKPEVWRNTIWALLAAGVFMGGISVYQYLTGNFGNEYWGFGRAELRQISGEYHGFRVTGPIGDSNFYAQILLVLLPLALDRLWHEKRPALRAAAGLALALVGLSFIFTFSRGAFLALIPVLGLMIWRFKPNFRQVALAAIAAVVLFQFVPSGYTERMKSLVEIIPGVGRGVAADSAFKGRASEMGVALLLFSEYPLAGVGAGNYPLYYPQYSSRLGLNPKPETRAAHSMYLQVAAELGIIGLIALAILVGVLFRSLLLSIRIFQEKGSHDLARLAQALLLGMSGYLLAGIFLHTAYPNFLWLLVGISFAAANVSQRLSERTDTPSHEVRSNQAGRQPQNKSTYRSGFRSPDRINKKMEDRGISGGR